MQSICELYRIGRGPSSSHTIAPVRALTFFQEEFGTCARYRVELYGSLSLTGKGHFTDKIIEETVAPAKVEILFKTTWDYENPNGLLIEGFNEENQLQGKWTVFSCGGGAIEVKEKTLACNQEVYKENSLATIQKAMEANKQDYLSYVMAHEPTLEAYLSQVLDAMLDAVRHGLNETGVLPGSLKVKRAAKAFYLQASSCKDPVEKQRALLMSYAYAAGEENAAGHRVVAAPTLGASGVLAALMYYHYTDCGTPRSKLIKSLAIAGIFGNLVKTNATISGALGGCQAEVGTACSMASAAQAYLQGLNAHQIEYAAEIGMEHNLGLTCDPVGGYVIIPCIERNAMAVLRAVDAAYLAKHMYRIKPNKVTFDMIVHTMNYTGKKLAIELKETALGGLAAEFNEEPHD